MNENEYVEIGDEDIVDELKASNEVISDEDFIALLEFVRGDTEKVLELTDSSFIQIISETSSEKIDKPQELNFDGFDFREIV